MKPGKWARRDAAEVHPEEAGDDGGDDADGDPGRDPSHVLVLAHRRLGACSAARALLSNWWSSLPALDDVGQRLVDVAEQRDDLGCDP